MPKNPSSTRKDAIPPTDLPSPPPPKVASTTSPSSASPKIPTSPSKHRGTFYKKSRSTSSQPPAPNPTDSSQSLKVAEVSTLSPPPPPPPPPLPSSLPPSTTSSPAPPVSPSSLFSSYSFAFPPSKSTSSGSISLLDQLGNPAGQLFRRVSVEDESKEGEKQKQETKKRAGKDLKAVKTMREREAAVLKERSEKALKEKSLLKTRSKREEPSAATPSSSLSTTTSEPPPLSVKPSSLKPPIPRSTPGVPTSTIPGASPKEERRRGKHPSTSVVAPLLHALSFDNPPPKSAAPISPPNSPQVATTPPPLASSSSSSPPSSPSSESIPTRPTTPDPPALVAVSKSIYHLAEDLRRKDQEFKESAEAQAAEVALGRARADPPFPPRHDGPSTQARAPLPPPPSLTTTSKPAVLGPTNGGGSSSSVSSAASSTTPLTPSAPPSHLASHPPVPLFPPNPSFPSSTSRPAAQGLSPTPYPHQKPPNRPNPIPPNGQFDASSSSPSSSRFQTGGPIPYSVISVDPKGKGREVPYGPPNPGFPTFQQQQQQQFQHPQGGPPRFRQQQQQPGPQSFSSDQRNRPPPPPPPQAFGCRPEPRPPDNLLRLGPSQPVDPTLRRGPDGRNQHQQYQNRSRSFHSDVQPSLPPSAVTVQPRAVLPYGRFPPSSNPPSSSRPPPTLERSRPSISPITTSIPLPTPPLHLLPPRPIDNFDQSQLRPEFQRRRSAPVDASRPSSPPVPSTPNPPDHTIETSISDGLSSSDFSAPPPPPPPPPAPIPPRCFTPTFLPSSNLTPGTRATDYLLKEKPQALAFQPRNARPSHSGPGGGGGGPSSPVAHHSRTTEEHQRRLDRDRADQQQQVPQEPRWIPPLHNRSGPNAEALDEELGRMGIGRLTSRKTNFTADCYVHMESFLPNSHSHPLDQPIDPHELRTLAQIRFGPVASISLIPPHRTRAFVTFESIGSALHAMMVSLPPEQGGDGGAAGDQKMFVFEPRKRMLVELYRGEEEEKREDDRRRKELERLRMRKEEEEEDRGETDGGRGLWKRRREEEERRKVLEGEVRREGERRRWEELYSESGDGGIGWREDEERERDERLVGEKGDLECPICMQLLNNPHILACCGHTLCLRCIEQVLQSPPRTCPCCREPIGKLIPNRLASTIVASFVKRSLFAFGEP